MKSPGNKEKSRVFTDESVNFVVISIMRGERSGLLTHIAATESVSLCERMKS
jgi:hypothetical protein